MEMPPDDLNTRYAAFDRACELDPHHEPSAWMPDAAVTPDSLPPGVRMVDIARLEAMHGTVITNEMLYRALHGDTEPEVSGLASDRELHPNRLVTLAVWLIGAAFLAFLIF